MKKLLTIIFSVVSFSALAAYQAGPMTTNKAAAYATTGQAPVFNGTQWVFVNTNVFGGGTATATNAIGNANGLGTNTSLFGNVGIGTTNPSHTLHVVTGTNNAVGVDSTGTDSSSMFHIHNYAGTQGPFFDFGAPPGRWGFGMSSVGSFNLRFTQDTNTDPVNGTTLVVFSTNGVITGDGSGLTNIPGSGLQSPLNVATMNVSNLVVTNAYLNLANSTNLPTSGIQTNANTANYLRGDGTWATPSGTAPATFSAQFNSSGGFTNIASGASVTNLIIWGDAANTNKTYTDSTGWHNTNTVAANNGVDISRGKVTAQQGFYGDSAGTTNATATYATNNSPNCLVFDAQLAKQLVITNASFSMVGFSNTVAGRLHSISICVSNSGSAITVTGPGAVRYIGAVSTNALVLAGGKMGYWTFDIWPGVLTNCANVAEQ